MKDDQTLPNSIRMQTKISYEFKFLRRIKRIQEWTKFNLFKLVLNIIIPNIERMIWCTVQAILKPKKDLNSKK